MYILGEREQDAKISRLVKTGTEEDGWTEIFADPATGERWILYYPHGQLQDGGPRFLRRGDLPEDVVTWATTLLREGSEADAIGAGTDLSEMPETWPALLDRLEAECELLPTDRVRLFINELSVLNPRNRRPILGKSVVEIDADAERFQELARRAAALVDAARASTRPWDRLLDRLRSALGSPFR